MARVMNLQDFLIAYYGSTTSYIINRETTTVGVTQQLILRMNPQRASFTVVNNGANAMRILPDTSVSTTNGYYIAANGGFATVSWDVDLGLPMFEWYAIAAGAGNAVTIIENIFVPTKEG